MKMLKTGLATGLVVWGLMVSPVTSAEPATPATTTRAVVQQWEYATLLVSPDLLTAWSSPVRTQEASGSNGLAVVYKALGGTRAASSVGIVDFLNLAGQSGWELVAIDRLQAGGTYIFKRPAR